jgi:hypothetical protein
VGTAERKGATIAPGRNDFMVAETSTFPDAPLSARLRRRSPDVAQYAIVLELYAGDAIKEPWRSQGKKKKTGPQ